MTENTVAKVAVSSVPFAVDRPYSYLIPPSLIGRLKPGMRVLVPFGRGNRHGDGVVLSLCRDSGEMKLKSIEEMLDDEPVLSDEMLKLALWMHERFFCTVYEAARAMLPAGMWFKDGERRVNDKVVSTAYLDIPAEEAMEIARQRRLRAPMQSSLLELLAQIGCASIKELCYFTGASRKSLDGLRDSGFVKYESVEVFRRPQITPIDVAPAIVLNESQQQAFEGLFEQIKAKKAAASLLYGVTGSGKTLVYIRLIQETLKLGRKAIVLVPEIALTPQLLATFAAYFGESIAVLHSALGIGERYDEWKRIRSGEVDVVIGTRSAIFAPLDNIGLIVLDEEQEYTYKSESSPRYHARDIAKYRCTHSDALLLLGSATPDVESMYAAEEGKYKLFRIRGRFNTAPLPQVTIADMKKDLKDGGGGMIGSVLRAELEENFSRGEQSILFINRRGTSTLVACGECGYTFTCPRCSVSMTYHAANGRFMCHYCGYSELATSTCPDCGGRLKFIGAGTQKIEEELGELFPGIEMIRMDLDTVSAMNSHEKLLSRFRNERVPILLGTQMVTKGLDFENVTLVGVLSADQMLYINDFRAHERTFSLITQVVGRSGRGSKPGRAVIQTLTPENEILRLAASQDYDTFYRSEIELRKLSGTPPVKDLYTLTVSGLDAARVQEGCQKLRSALIGYLSDVPDAVVLGPAPAPVAKVNNRFRFVLTLSCIGSKRIRNTISHLIREFSRDPYFKNNSVYADLNPYH